MRIALGLQYCGEAYHGWQRQNDLATVQEELEYSLTKIASHPVTVFCAGRTDTGVHANAQVVHFDTTVVRNLRAWVYGANTYLPKDISVQWAQAVSDDFHARHSATARHYRYFLANHRVRPALFSKHLSWHYGDLQVEAMQLASTFLVGRHDFSAFRAVGCQSKTPIKSVSHFEIQRNADVIQFDISADAFLHHMVRNIVGVMLLVGMGKRPPEWVQEVLQSLDRRQGGITAAPFGLYLAGVTYPDRFGLPKMDHVPTLYF